MELKKEVKEEKEAKEKEEKKNGRSTTYCLDKVYYLQSQLLIIQFLFSFSKKSLFINKVFSESHHFVPTTKRATFYRSASIGGY